MAKEHSAVGRLKGKKPKVAVGCIREAPKSSPWSDQIVVGKARYGICSELDVAGRCCG